MQPGTRHQRHRHRWRSRSPPGPTTPQGRAGRQLPDPEPPGLSADSPDSQGNRQRSTGPAKGTATRSASRCGRETDRPVPERASPDRRPRAHRPAAAGLASGGGLCAHRRACASTADRHRTALDDEGRRRPAFWLFRLLAQCHRHRPGAPAASVANLEPAQSRAALSSIASAAGQARQDLQNQHPSTREGAIRRA